MSFPPYLLAAIGALALAALAARLKRLRGRTKKEEEFVGGYRTRPPGPLAPDPPIAPRVVPKPPGRPAWVGRLGMLLTGLALTAAGVFMMVAGRTPADRFHGTLSTCFFGLCTWVFVEQLAGRSEVLSRGAGFRSVAVMIGASALTTYLAWETTAVPLIERVLIGLAAVTLAVLGMVGQWKMWKRWRATRGRG